MSWIRSSKAVAAVVLLVVALGAVGTAAAVSFSADDPEATQVGETVSFQVEMTDVFEDQPNEWTVAGNTDLEDASWQIIANDVSGEEVARSDSSELQVSSEDGINTVTIEVEGTVPEISTYSYENMEEEEYQVLQVEQAGGPSLNEWRAHRYTEASREARNAIDDASDAVDSQSSLDNAISAYNSENFDNAVDLAQQAQDDAEGEQQLQQYLLFGGAALAVLLIAGGGYYAYQQRQEDRSKLR
ncbi:hypothetical protein SAMN05216226_10857 [Halovenus aranensis]|uniref:Uncharacterized protein n=1 Tax=Halovenus aranensis TaxID=890420 RepID=A0A1G8W3X0_9EURY|nr:hypothetical protein [Halovenus aranensis]SDJ72949.1 hypothetical protein SAMN05216226_10857 [Halovenus aranensis]